MNWECRVSFPALHLNRMTPIKNTVQQSGAAPGANFSIKFKIGNTFFFSNPFKLVSAVNQIPNEEATEPMRPRKSKSVSIIWLFLFCQIFLSLRFFSSLVINSRMYGYLCLVVFSLLTFACNGSLFGTNNNTTFSDLFEGERWKRTCGSFAT